jgi:choloylglycine hydrolase
MNQGARFMINFSKIIKLSICLGVAWMTQFSSLQSCTGIKLVAKDGSIVHGRTFEFGIEVPTSFAVIPRGYDFIATTDKGPGLKYKSKYAAVGAIAFDNPALMDGINEKGLAVGVFYFPGYAGYSTITAQNQSKALSPIDFSNWILTQFATLEEVKAALADVIISPTVYPDWGSTPAPFHYIVYDKSGHALVIEPMNGNLVTYDNKLGVITNSPTFDWHMTNLRNFINLTPFNVKPLNIDGLVLAPFGQGSGMVGLPGDFTPPSRFVRASIFSITATPSANSNEAVLQAFHILNQFDIPVGNARQKVGNVIYSDFTLCTCVRDPQALKYFMRTFQDQTIRMVDLTKFDLNAKAIKQVSTAGFQPIVDITSDLK